MAHPRTAIVAPNAMTERNILETPVISLLAQQEGIDTMILSPSSQAGEGIRGLGKPHLGWAPVANPLQGNFGICYGQPERAFRRLVHRVLMKPFLSTAGFGNLAYRFNEKWQFTGHLLKKQVSPERMEREAKAGNFLAPRLGRPFPTSQFLFNLFTKAYYSPWYGEPGIEAFFDHFRPHLLVLSTLQFESLRPYATAAKARGVRILGLVGSWDQPTTKGPLCPGPSRYLVQSEKIAGELVEYHDVSREIIEVIGWPQMDCYFHPSHLASREALFAELGLPLDRRYILLAGNSSRLGAHEPSVASRLAQEIRKGLWGDDVSLVIRPHPKDFLWQERFAELQYLPEVAVLPAEKGRLAFLANLLRHAGVLVSSGGSICLDAIALDTCVVLIGFDGDIPVRPEESIRRWHEMEHFQSVADSGGVKICSNYEELFSGIADYFNNPDLDQDKRRECLRQHLSPLDGHASQRLVDCISAEAHLAFKERSKYGF